MNNILTDDSIAIMREAGTIAANIMNSALLMATPGTKTIEINDFIEKEMQRYNVEPWFKEVDDYPYGSCISVNEVWLHGIPNNTKLKKDDVISIDLGVKYKNHYIDHCWSISVADNYDEKNIRNQFSNANPEIQKFLETGVKALYAAISRAIPKNRVGDISYAMQSVAEKEGYNVINGFGGHGIGYDAHLDPHIPCFGVEGSGKKIKKNMALAIEIMYSMGNPEWFVNNKDNWSIITKDNSITAMFEHTVIVTNNEPEILTK